VDIDFRKLGVAGTAAAVRDKTLSAREAVQAALDAIAAHNPTINAFVAVDGERALEAAAAIDTKLAKGEQVGPLAGVPIGVKDLEDAEGFVTSSGSAAYAHRAPAARDSVQVARLRAAGCVVVGKTNAPEFGLRGETDNPTFGITRNPWDPTRTPGGSSGGTSAALAAGMVPLATGSDGGGSIRIPSAATGLSGLKPTQGWVPAADRTAVGWGELSTRGPMARRVTDVALALDAVIGPDSRDLRSLPVHGSWAAEVATPLRPARIAWSPDLGYAQVDAEVQRICEAVVDAIGADDVEVSRPDRVFTGDPTATLGALVSTYTRRTVEPFRGTPVWEQLDPLVMVAAEMSRVTVSDALAVVAAEDACHRFNLELQEVLDDVDVLLCPVTVALPPACENPVGIDAMAALFAGIGAEQAVADLGLDDPDGLLAQLRRREPLNIPLGVVNGQPVGTWHGMTQAFNMTRSPAGTVCAGFSSTGLPVGIQIVGRRLDDVRVLRIMHYLEQLLGLDPIAPGWG
jgi:Asp-tRNA(Asn)/Glu-tRNA(Gln) amidotransferase A subunit family amidase